MNERVKEKKNSIASIDKVLPLLILRASIEEKIHPYDLLKSKGYIKIEI